MARLRRTYLPFPRQPQECSPINWDNQLTAGLVASFDLSGPQPGMLELVNGIQATGSFADANGTRIYQEPSPLGLGVYVNNGYLTHQPGAGRSPYEFATAGAMSIIVQASAFLRTQGIAYMLGMFTSSRINDIRLHGTSGLLQLGFGGANYVSSGSSTDTTVDGVTGTVGCAWSADSASVDFYVNGVLHGTASTGAGAINDLGDNPYATLGGGSGLDPNTAYSGNYAGAHVFARKLAAEDFRALTADFWQMRRAPAAFAGTYAAGAGGGGGILRFNTPLSAGFRPSMGGNFQG